MGLKEEWSNMPGRTKMFIVGGGGLALFFLYTGIKNRNTQQNQTQNQDTSVGPQQPAIDPTSWIDSQNQQMQQMQQVIGGIQDSLNQYQQSSQQSQQQSMQSLQELVQQNQQATQQQIQSLHDAMSTPPTYNPVPVTPAPPVVSNPIPVPSAPVKQVVSMTTGTFTTADQAAKVAAWIQKNVGPNVRIVGSAGNFRVQADTPSTQGAKDIINGLKKNKLISVGYVGKVGG